MYEIYAFFNARQIYDILNAVVLIMGGGDFNGLLRTIGVCGLIVAAVYGIVKVRGEEPIGYILAFGIMYGMLFLPKVTVNIIDPIRAQTYTVANVPIGLGFLASTTNKIGKWLTLTFDTNFSPVDSTQFSKHGMLFGAKVVQEMSEAKMTQPELLAAIKEFSEVCLAPEFANTPSAADAFVKSTNIWNDIASNAIVSLNPGRLVVMPGYAPMGCPAAATSLNNRLTSYANTEINYVAKQLFPESINAGADLNSAVTDFNSMLLSSSADAVATLKQAVMLNMIRDGHIMGRKSNSTDVAINLATASASQASKVSYAAMAKIAEGALPKLRNVIDLTIISLFPIIFVLAMLAGTKGGMVLKAYVMGMMWVQLWAPLYSVINYLMNFQLQTTLLPKTQVYGGMNLVNVLPIQSGAISEQAIAGMLTISIPIIAYAIVKGGEVAMSSVASSLMNPATSAASAQGAAAGLGSSSAGNAQWSNVGMSNSNIGNNTWGNNTGNNSSIGNNTWGNLQSGNSSWNNVSANKQDASASTTDPGKSTYSNAWGSLTMDSDGGFVSGSLAKSDMGGTAFGTSNTQGRSASASSEVSASAMNRLQSGLSSSTSSGFLQGYGSNIGSMVGSAYEEKWGTGGSHSNSTGYQRAVGASRSGDLTQQQMNSDSFAIASGAQVGGSASNGIRNSSSTSDASTTSTPLGGKGGAGAAAPGGSSAVHASTDRNDSTVHVGKSADFKASSGATATTAQQALHSALDKNSGASSEERRQALTNLLSATQAAQGSATTQEQKQGLQRLSADLTSALQATSSRSAESSSGETAKRGVTDTNSNQASLSQDQSQGIWAARFAANNQNADATIRDMATNGHQYAQEAMAGKMAGGFKSENGVGSGPRSVEAVQASGNASVAAAGGSASAAVGAHYSSNAAHVQSQMPSTAGLQGQVDGVRASAEGQISAGGAQVGKLGSQTQLEAGASKLGSSLYQQEERGIGTVVSNAFLGGAGSLSPAEYKDAVSRVASYDSGVRAIANQVGAGVPATKGQLDYVADAVAKDRTK